MQCVQCRTVLDLHGEEQLVEVVSALGGQDHDAQQRESAAVLANLEESVITLNEVQQRGRFAGSAPAWTFLTSADCTVPAEIVPRHILPVQLALGRGIPRVPHNRKFDQHQHDLRIFVHPTGTL